MAAVISGGVDNAFYQTSDGIRSNINDVQKSDRYYVTQELNKEINRINNGVNHMKLDSDFINNSQQWGQKFGREALNREKAESAKLMSRGNQVIGDLKSKSQVSNVSSMEANQIREMHEWAGRSLDGVKQDLHPYARSAQGRIDQFCDSMGVTDRYTGYRHNLTRGSRDLCKLGMGWLKDKTTNSYTANTSSGHRLDQSGVKYLPASLPKRRVQGEDANIQHTNPVTNNSMTVPNQPRMKSIQERCGINTTFPGITEYMKRYNRKQLPEKLSAFQINPTPDISIYGRPSALVEWTPNFTEYQTRYEWPQCSEIVKKPWLRK